MTDKSERTRVGEKTFQEVLHLPVFPATTPATEAARDFIFAEVWSRPGLDRRSRRWITLACVCAAGAPTAMRTYIRAALVSGDITEAELREFVLQFGVFQGFPKAMEIELLISEIVAAEAAK